MSTKQTARRRKARAQPSGEAMVPADMAETMGDAADAAQEAFEQGVAGQQSKFGMQVDEPDPVGAEEARQSRLNALAGALQKKREAAVLYRSQSGIEDQWREDEEAYEGIDAANRGDSVTVKPRDPNNTGGATVSDSTPATGSTLYLNITRPYVDFSAGRAADMLLPTDDLNWDMSETPMPDVIKAFTDTNPLKMNNGAPPPPDSPQTIGDAAKAMVEEARRRVQKAKTRIQDWHEECQFNAEQRKMLKLAAKVGVAILKGPVPTKKTTRALTRDKVTGLVSLVKKEETAPKSVCISHWNFYPAAGCGDDIQKGDGCWEADDITARQMRDLLGTADSDGNPMYLEDAIKTCLMEGPQRLHENDRDWECPDAAKFRIWYYTGVATAEDLAAAGVTVDEGSVIPVTITMVNDRVIKAAKSTLQHGGFPYDVMVWQPIEGFWAGIGVARQVSAPQRMINAGVRNMLDNAGMGSGPQIIISHAVKPMGKNAPYGIRPRKMWQLDKDAGIDDVRKAMLAIEIPMVTDELLKIIQFALKMAEDTTGLPMLLQGQQGQASETVGGMQILTNNSNTPMRAIAKLYDDRVTVPHILRYYEWLLLYGPEEDEKGEFVVSARGSSALFERDAQNQAILQMAALVGNPQYKINPEKWLALFLKAQRLNAADLQYSDVEWAQVEEKMKNSPPPEDPRIAAAKIAAGTREKVATIAADVQKERIAKDTDRDLVYAQAETERSRIAEEGRREELQLKREIAYLEYATQEKISLQTAKTQMADTTMKLQVQRELSAMSAGVDLHKHNGQRADQAEQRATEQAITPPTEPAGRAPDGEAFQA